MKNIIHIFGASGSGTTTLGKTVSRALGYSFLDTDDFFWAPTDPPYTTPREKSERIRLLRESIDKSNGAVISGSLAGWGDDFIPEFTLAVRLVTPTEVRIERLKKREYEHFGDRVMPGGDMYQINEDFLEWAAQYDTGDENIRSKLSHDIWQKQFKCKLIYLDGSDGLEKLSEAVTKELAV